MIRRIVVLIAVAAAIIAAGFGIGRGMRVAVNTLSEDSESSVPTMRCTCSFAAEPLPHTACLTAWGV